MLTAMGSMTCSSSAICLCASSDTSLFIPKPINYIHTAYLVMPGQSDGDPLDQDLHSEPPLISSSRGDWAPKSYAPQTVPSSMENPYVCPPIDVPPTVIPYHLQYSVPERLSDSSAPTLFSPYSAFLGDQIMPNGTSCYPQPGINPIPAALPPTFPFHMPNPPMPYSYTSIHYLCHKLPLQQDNSNPMQIPNLIFPHSSLILLLPCLKVLYQGQQVEGDSARSSGGMKLSV